MSEYHQRFFLKVIDPDYGCPVLETMFIVNDLAALRALLGESANNDPELRASYWLDEGGLAALNERFGVTIARDGEAVTLERWHWLRLVPYLVHTNYELFLLLEGTKKFARMGIEYPPDQHDGQDLFDKYVEQGVLHKKVELRPFPTAFIDKNGYRFEGVREVYYTRMGEEWRISAWKMLSAASQIAGWNETCECMEGMLFGYEEWQINWWASQRRKHLAPRPFEQP